MHNLERIDASQGWLGVVLRIPAFLRTPHLDKIAKLLDSLHDAAPEETVRLEVGIVLLHEHDFFPIPVRNCLVRRLSWLEGKSQTMASRENLYEDAVRTYGSALDRLARAYEADSEARRDLLQEIHLGRRRSLESFDARCSLRTWIYRVAHNVACSHVDADRRSKARQLVSIEGMDVADDKVDAASLAN